MRMWRSGSERMPCRARSTAVAAALATASALVLAGCAFLAPQPGPTPSWSPDCLDSESAEAGLPPGTQDGLEVYGLWSQTWQSPPGAGDLAHPAPVPPGFDPNRRIWLTSILLAPGVNGRVSIVKPQDARLFVAPNWDRMGSLTALDLQLGARRSVDLTGCDGVASYPGLTIVDGPECVVFAVQREGDDRVAQISVPFFGAEC